jgi:outer membrane receptor protein involved in Fe transport
MMMTGTTHRGMREGIATAGAVIFFFFLAGAGSRPAWANDDAAAPSETGAAPLIEHVQVTATRVPESTEQVPASVTVLTRDDLLLRGARDLTSALALVAGVSIAPGGDGGPASSVPEFWGLREFDAFLLTVDGVPWGGAFAPALPTLDLSNVDRIEVLRGAAPVMYGATSFVGVINVIRRDPGEGKTTASVAGGSYGTALANLETPLPAVGSLKSSVSADLSDQGFKDDRTGIKRGLFHWQGEMPGAGGTWRFHAGSIVQRQDPASPRILEGDAITSEVPLDANVNPEGAKLDENRYVADTNYTHKAGSGDWTTTFSVIHADQNILRGFLTDITAPVDNANGFRQDITTTDLYFDSHLTSVPAKGLKLVYGVDFLHGGGDAQGGDFDYTVNLDGSSPPRGSDLPSQADVQISDHRNFAGVYGQAFWTPAERWNVEVGARANHTSETRQVYANEFGTGVTTASDELSQWRGSGTAGVTYTAWQKQNDALRVFAYYRNTYKPAVIDFGLDADPEILNPETGHSYEAGAKSRLWNGRLGLELTAFQMELQNIVVAQDVGGLPGLTNAGEERLRGLELGADVALPHALFWRVNYSLHDAKFADFLTDLGAGQVQLAGNRLPMSARHMASTGLNYAPSKAWQGWVQANYVGSRSLNEENDAFAAAYVTCDAGLGYRLADSWVVRLDAWNIGDVREPVSQSELGDGQLYVLPARTVTLGLRWTARP